jgi:two-component system phosphate regulon sensor histidine kinase PhoR
MHTVTLRWAVGIFAVLLGAMILIVPHRFESALYVALLPHLPAWGSAFLVTGTGLLAAAVLPRRSPAVITAHLAAGAVFLFAAHGFAASGAWLRVAAYAMLGVGVLAAPVIEARWPASRDAPGSDLLVLVIAATTILGSVSFLVPSMSLPRFAPALRPSLPWFAAAFGLAGAGLAATQLARGVSRRAAVALHLTGAATFLAFVEWIGLLTGDWAALAYYGGAAAFLGAFPWMDSRLRRIDPLSLRARLALVLTFAAATPLIAVVTILTDRSEQSAAVQALLLHKTIADTLADDIARNIGFYRATAAGLAKTINLAQMPAARQGSLLWGLSADYPDAFAFGTYDDHGHLLARADVRAPDSIAGSALYAQALGVEQSGGGDQVSMVVGSQPGSDRLLFQFGAPLRGPDGSWAGLLVLATESVRVTQALQGAARQAGGKAFMVDAQGRVVAKDPGALTTSFRDLTDDPAVAALIARPGSDGAVRFRAADGSGEQLAGYAPVAGTRFGVVMERPLPVALAGARASREIAFGILLLVVAGAAVGGIAVAGVLVRPLEALARETRRMGMDSGTVSLPQTRVTEIRELAETFGEMRRRLGARTEERERAHAALREREARIRSILESTSDGFVFLGRDGRIKSANRRAAALIPLGDAWRAEGDLAAVLAKTDVPPAAREAVIRTIHAFTATGEAAGEGDLELGAGRRVLHWDAQAARDETGASAGLTFTLRDVTQEREVSQMKSDFVAFVTHQLRTPLSGIKWLLELAADTPDAGEMRAYIQDAREANERLVGLVNDLLDISRLESGRLTVSPQPLHVGTITESVLQELDPLIKDKGHRLSLSGFEEVPPVVADPQLVRQVILNLLSNAIKYTPPRGEIALQVGQENGCIRWVVRDTGIGIPQDALPRLFEKFYRANNVHKVETEGTGLGLYLVRLIVERCGGEIWCESEEGRGATFQFTVPLQGGPTEWRCGPSGS